MLVRSLLVLCIAIPAPAGESLAAQTNTGVGGAPQAGQMVEALPDPCRLDNPPPECTEAAANGGVHTSPPRSRGVRLQPNTNIQPQPNTKQ